jgi:outer membrane protein assembly factor BamB
MRRIILGSLAVAALLAGGLLARADPFSVLDYHGGPNRSGHFVVPNLSWDRARSLHFDPAFHADIPGQLYAQPLYWQPADSRPALLIAVTESNVVYALDARTGATLWKHELGPPVAREALPCGDIAPLGVTGTPVIDPQSETLYLDAAVALPTGASHLVFALALRDGTVRPGWPADIGGAFAGQDPPFISTGQNQRGALLLVGGMVYVPFGSFFDCRPYHGTVVGVSLADPHKVTRWATRGAGGGVWAPGGVASDGASLFIATGNTYDAADWADGEAIIRLSLDLQGSTFSGDFFTPSDWRDLDQLDSDLGGIAPLLIDLPEGDSQRPVVLALGKDGKAYLLDRLNLGGVGGELAATKVSTHGAYAGAAVYPIADSIYVAFPTEGIGCPADETLRGLIVLSIHGGNPPTLATAWCAQMKGFGAPIVTTTDGRSNPIVWAVGAQGDGLLHAFKGDTGEVLFSGPLQGLAGLHRLQTLIATQDRIYVGADGTIYAFAF